MEGQSYDSIVSNSSRRKLLGAIGGAGVAMAAGCLGDEDEGGSAGLSAAWILYDEPGDLGWTFSHDEGISETEAMMDDLDTEVVEDVDAADVQQTASEFADGGYDVIFGSSADFTDPMAAASEQYPDTAFEVASGIDTGENYGSYYSKNYQSRYLIGYASGMVTETDAIGYVAANPVATVYQDINGFAAGVEAANPDATVHIQWTNNWYDPPTEGENAQILIDDENVDVMAQHQDSPAALETAADNDIWASGYAAPMGEYAGDNYLMTPVFHWEVVHEIVLNDVRSGDWEAGITFPGLADGATELSDPGPEVPDDVVDEVMGIRDEMLDGDADDIVWGGTTFEDWSDEEILFDSASFGIDNIEGEEL